MGTYFNIIIRDPPDSPALSINTEPGAQTIVCITVDGEIKYKCNLTK